MLKTGADEKFLRGVIRSVEFLNLLSFISYVCITTFTPGPNNISSMSNAIHLGFVKSQRYRLGIFFGFFLVMMLGALFSASLLRLIPVLKPYMMALGAAYILWLAWKTWTSHNRTNNNAGSECSFMSGFALQFVNVKVILSGITVMSTYVLPHTNSLLVLFCCSLALAMLAFISVNCWSAFGAVFSRFLREHERVINAFMALLLVYCAVSLYL